VSYTPLQVLTAASMNRFLSLAVFKSVTQSVTSSTTLVNDTELTLSLPAGGTYLVKVCLIVGGAQAGDFKCAYTTTGTLTLSGARTCTGPSQNTTDASGTAAAAVTVGVNQQRGGFTLATVLSYGTDGGLNCLVEESFILTTTTASTVTLQWAQLASSATATTVAAGSYMIAQPLVTT
jgi:hypothetical protein